MPAYTVLDDEALNYVKGIELPAYAALRLLAGRNAVRRFCKDTGIYQVTLPFIPLVAATAGYALTLATNTELVYVVWVKVRRTAETDKEYRNLTARTRDFMDTYHGPTWEFHEGSPVEFVVDPPQTVLLYPIPETGDAGRILVRVALMPSSTAGTDFPDFIYSQYREALLHAYLHEAYSFTNKPWSSPELAAAARGRYEEEIYFANSMSRQGQNQAEGAPYFPGFGGSRNADGWN